MRLLTDKDFDTLRLRVAFAKLRANMVLART
jgi:hypothetical protein